MIDNNISVKTNNHINENAVAKIKTKTEMPINLPDPARVTKTPQKEADSQIKQELFSYNPDSVHDKFVKLLQNSPALSEPLRKLLLSKQFINVNIKRDPMLSVFFESFLKNIEMNDSEILEFLKFQKNTRTKFQGEFFDEIKNLLAGADNEDFKSVLQSFLRSYDCFTSVEETYKSIGSAMKNIEKNLPDILKLPFNEMAEKLTYDAKHLDLNLSILKGEVIPFLSRYISRMNDFGVVRDYVSVLVHNIIRLEFAEKDYFACQLEKMFDYLKYNFNFDAKQMEELKLSLISTYEEVSDVENKSLKAFFKMLKKGASESKNPVNKGLMREVADSLIFSHNVNMPLIHMFLPLSYKGLFMFSDIWIGEDNKGAKNDNDRGYKAFITFDIEGLGYFETILNLREKLLSLDISVPHSISAHTEKIKKDLSEILCKNDIIAEGINVRECTKAKKFSEVFSNLAERKNGVDVTI